MDNHHDGSNNDSISRGTKHGETQAWSAAGVNVLPSWFVPTKYFGRDVRSYLTRLDDDDDGKEEESCCEDNDENGNAQQLKQIDFTDPILRQVMEPHIEKARQGRAKAWAQLNHIPAPYPALRNAVQQKHISFSKKQFPWQQELQNLLGVTTTTDDDNNLAQLHTVVPVSSKKELLQPLLSASARWKFHETYERFVHNLIVPYLHQQYVNTLFPNKRGCRNDDDDDGERQHRLLVRYQAFPCLRVVRPGEFSIGPHCDLAYGHALASLNVYVPLSSPIGGTNALYAESQPGLEDWQPLWWDNHNEEEEEEGKSDNNHDRGVAIVFDGAQCLHFTLENTTPFTRVSMDFRIALHDTTNESSSADAMASSRPEWDDRYSEPPGYYAFCESVFVSSPNDANDDKNGHDTLPHVQVLPLGEPIRTIDRRVGFPF